MADNKIQPDSRTWMFITMGFIESNKNTTDRAKSILVGDNLNLADNAPESVHKVNESQHTEKTSNLLQRSAQISSDKCGELTKNNDVHNVIAKEAVVHHTDNPVQVPSHEGHQEDVVHHTGDAPESVHQPEVRTEGLTEHLASEQLEIQHTGKDRTSAPSHGCVALLVGSDSKPAHSVPDKGAEGSTNQSSEKQKARETVQPEDQPALHIDNL